MSQFLRYSIASEKDIPQLTVLVNSAYRGDSSKKGWTTEADLLDGIRTDADSLRHMIGQENSVIVLCTGENNELKGCVNLQKQNLKMYLGMLTVSPFIQSQGIGKELLKKAESYAMEQGCTSIILTVITVRKELIEWYERRGFFKTGERKPFPNDPKFGIPKQQLEFLVMEKNLQP